MNKLVQFLTKVVVGKQLTAVIAWAHTITEGKRSQIILVVMAIAYALQLSGVLTPEQVDALDKILAPALGVTLWDKFAKVKSQISAVVPEVKQEPKQ